MDKLKFVPPGDDEPGFLERIDEFLGIDEEFKKNPSRKTVGKIVEMLLPFVEEPADRDEAKKLLMKASKKELRSMVKAVIAEDTNPT